MCFVGGEMDWVTNPNKKRKMSHHLFDHKKKITKQQKVNISNPINTKGKWSTHALEEAMDVVEGKTISLRKPSRH
jgi:hypothetical protein